MTPDHRPATDGQPDADAEHGDAVGVVHGAVERVDDPHPLVHGRWPGPLLPGDGAASPRRRRAARFLGQERVVGKRLADGIDDQLLGERVDFGDHVVLGLVHDALEALVALHLQPAGMARGVHRDGHLRVQSRRASGRAKETIWATGRL